MRADRLLSMLLLLQQRGRMPARLLAKELEVSERTIYRDVVALSTAGVPVYAETGREGGYALVDSYRTSLTGLNEGEARALFMLSIPAPLERLGLGPELKSALLKLSAALPASQQQAEERARQRFLDSSWWRQAEEPVPHLQSVHAAVWGDHKLWIRYVLPPGVSIEQEVEPYSLVAKAGVWYMVYFFLGKPRVQRLAELLEVRLLDGVFQRSADFNLEHFWQAWCLEQERQQQAYLVKLRAAPGLLPWLPALFGAGLGEKLASGETDDQGGVVFELAFRSLEEARSRLLGLGRAVEVLAPRPLRLSLQDYAEQIASLYRKDASPEQV